MQKLQDSVFSIVKTTNLSPAVFSFLQPTEDISDKTPLGGILNDTRHGWLALGPKFCVVDLKTGLKVAARTFGTPYSNSRTTVTSVVELPTPLTENSKQLIISLQCEDITSTICVFHVNGSQILQCIQTDLVVAELAVCDDVPDGPFTCFDGVIMAGTRSGEVFAFDLNRAGLIQALKDISQGYEDLIQSESNPSNLSFLPLDALQQLEEQRDLVLANNDHLAILLNENSVVDGQYIFRNPDGSVRMKAKRDHIRVTVLQYIPQLGSLAVGYNFGAFQIWNLLTLELEFTSQVNVECLPVTHFGFQEPCDDPRAFCYLWVVFSVLDRFEEEGYPLAVMYSLTYQGKRMLSDTKCLYQEFSMATIRFQVELSAMEDVGQLLGGKCVSCHTYSVNSTLGSEGEDSMLNICQLVWECWGESANSSSQYGMLLFDLDQWYKDQMPATYRLESNAFMSATWCSSLAQGACVTLDVRLDPTSVSPYTHATRLEEHFYPNSLQYNCICLNTSEACVLNTIGIQRQIISSMDDVGPTALLNPPRLYSACVACGLTPLYTHAYNRNVSQEDQRRFLLSVALEARLSRFLRRAAHDWAAGSHAGAGCTLPFLVDWCWQRAVELKENARELTTPLFTSSALPDRNVIRCLEHCVQQLTQLTGLLDAILTKCCNLVVPDALSAMEEQYKGIGTVALYLQVVQWFLRVGLLPERDAHGPRARLPYPAQQLQATYTKRRMKLQRLEDNSTSDGKPNKSCSLLYIDQLIENEFGGERIHDLWVQGGSECGGLYPPPSLYSLLRLYLLPDIPEEHKHSLVLYLLVDYSVLYDETRYEAVIRRLMQFPTMFGLSNTAIKATQAFWHLDHRDFDFALDQLQCLTGNTLSEWQHNVVLSSLLAQKKTQAALQYLHVRKPAPIQCKDNELTNRVKEPAQLSEWQACVSLYLARGLVCEALDVVRESVGGAADLAEKVQVLTFFYKGCRSTGQLSKILQVSLTALEEDVFIKYLKNCNETQTSDILVMYYLQQARYIEAEQYNNKLRHNKTSRVKEMTGSAESLADMLDREGARDTIVEVVCSSLPAITNTVRDFVLSDKNLEPHVIAPKPMSVYIQAKSPINTFTYKSSFIQDTIENASETWMNRPKMRRGIKRALNVEETPFICTPKLTRTKSVFTDLPSDSTPPKRPKMDLNATPRTPKFGSAVKLSPELSRQMASLLDMPLVQSPDMNLYNERTGAETPHSILKIRRGEAMDRDAPSPVDSRYLGDSDDELLETGSNHTHYSDSTNKHLRFTIPTASESGSTPSPPVASAAPSYVHRDVVKEREMAMSAAAERERDDDSHFTSGSHAMDEVNPLESPPKKLAVEEKVKSRKSYKDTVRGRRSLSISANSSLSEDPNTSIESIADIPITLINPRYSGERRRQERDGELSAERVGEGEQESRVEREVSVPKTPTGRRGIRAVGGESTPIVNRSRSGTPERLDSPITPLRTNRMTRSRSRTPSLSPRASPLQPIPELPRQEVASEPHHARSTLSVPRPRSRSRTPERLDKGVMESPRLEAITESPPKASAPESPASPRRSLRSRSRTPDVEMTPEEPRPSSPRSLRSRAKTPEKLMSPKREHSARGKKPLSRLVLEHNTFAKLKSEAEAVQEEVENAIESNIESTPMKALKQVPSLMDVTLSPIVNKSILQSSTDSALSETVDKDTTKAADKTDLGLKPLPAFTTIHETYLEKSVLRSYQSSIADISRSIVEDKEQKTDESATNVDLKSLPAFTTLNETDFNRSVLHSYESSVNVTSQSIQEETKETKVTEVSVSKPFTEFTEIVESNFEKSVLKSYQSSMAESSQEISKDETSNKSGLKDASLITNDSDVEMKENTEWKAKIDDAAAVIQKEKERIVDIEREINEIEGDMTDDDTDGDEAASSGDEEIVEAGSEAEDEESSDSSEDGSSSESDEEIISIKDTESDESSSSNKLQIDEGTSTDADEYDIQRITQVLQAEEACKKKEISKELVNEEEGKVVDPLNQGQISMLTDDNSVVESDKSDLGLNYSDEVKASEANKAKDVPMETEEAAAAVQVLITVTPADTEKPAETIIPVVVKDIDVVDSVPAVDTVEPAATQVEEIISETPTSVTEVENKNTETNVEETPKEPLATIPTDKAKKDEEKEVTSQSEDTEKESEKSAPKTRKRTKSTSSNKSIAETKDVEPKTPVTRKRTQSNASNRSEEQKTPESVLEETATPSRRRAKTPSSTEVRKIITRRASKEMSEKLDDSKEILDDSATATPKRRSTRSRTKNIDDNESVASESSVRSVRSRASEDAGDVKTMPVRKGRKSILSTKPDLSVIPEMIVEEESKGADEIISDYSSSRRLTRHQKAVLESWLEPGASPSQTKKRGRRTSAASRTSVASAEDDDASSTHSFDVQPIDRISLLAKQDFEGSPDIDEYPHASSPDSVASDASKQRRARLGRAASEVKPVKAAKIGRRTSVDIAESGEVGSPAGLGSPARGRRASFNKACEALHTPKGRRTSTDLRKDIDSPVESPPASEAEASTPGRRTRRAASNASNASAAKSDAGKRTKKTSALDESKDKKK